jgi:hypothetical protein
VTSGETGAPFIPNGLRRLRSRRRYNGKRWTGSDSVGWSQVRIGEETRSTVDAFLALVADSKPFHTTDLKFLTWLFENRSEVKSGITNEIVDVVDTYELGVTAKWQIELVVMIKKHYPVNQ